MTSFYQPFIYLFLWISYLLPCNKFLGVILKGVEAQTLANVYLALENNLEIIPVSLIDYLLLFDVIEDYFFLFPPSFGS